MQAMLDRPSDQAQLLEKVKSSYGPKSAIYCGGAELASADFLSPDGKKNTLIDISGLSAVREHVLSDMVLGVETGILISDLRMLLAEHGQMFACDMAAPNLRLIDVINGGDGGYLEQAYGYLRSSILGVDLVYESGKKASFGGRVVKNVTGYDLTKLIVGGRGVFGIASHAYLRLFARAETTLNIVVHSRSAADLIFLVAKLSASGLPLSALELLEQSEGAGSAYSWTAFVQISGPKSLVAEVASQVKSLIGSYQFLDVSAETLKQTLPMLTRPQEIGLELALSRASAAALIDHLGGFGERGLIRYRQSNNRLFLDCGDLRTLENAHRLVSTFLSDTKVKTGGNALADFDQATIARVNGPLSYVSNCERAGSGEAFVAGIIERLRKTFDPEGCFGNGVTFHGR
jgi:FAD/FMN-containing dehydrogenase